jgi:uncharacterized SAM-binding protein YcdF (DUF218 family)
MRTKRIASITASVALLGAMAFLFREPVMLAIGDYLVIQDELKPADVIHVIAGPDDRTDYAIQLYKRGYAKQIFFTGGWCTFHGYYHGQHGAERAKAQGIAPERIAIDESRVTSTYDEVVLLKEFIAKSQAPIRSAIVVSDPYHMRRARWTYRQVFGKGIEVLMAPVPFGLTPYQRRWWTDWASQRYVRDEYVKLAYYYARYRLSWGPIRRWLTSLDRE